MSCGSCRGLRLERRSDHSDCFGTMNNKYTITNVLEVETFCETQTFVETQVSRHIIQSYNVTLNIHSIDTVWGFIALRTLFPFFVVSFSFPFSYSPQACGPRDLLCRCHVTPTAAQPASSFACLVVQVGSCCCYTCGYLDRFNSIDYTWLASY